MTLTEIPHAYLLQWGGLWMPFAAKISKREGKPLSEVVGEALCGEARIFVIWGADGRPTGATATRLIMRNGTTPIGELHWLAGNGMASWFSACLPILEQILIRDHGVVAFKTNVRPGLEPHFRRAGFRRKRVLLEKRIF